MNRAERRAADHAKKQLPSRSSVTTGMRNPLPLSPKIAADMEMTVHIAVETLRTGAMDEIGWNTVAKFLNLIFCGARRRNNAKIEELVSGAMDAISAVRARHDKTGHYVATGDELEAIKITAEIGGRFLRNQTNAAVALWLDEIERINDRMARQAQNHSINSRNASSGEMASL
jgi:hypothetical protein